MSCTDGRGVERCVWVPARDLMARRKGAATAGLDALSPDRILQLPYRTQPTVITLKPGVSKQTAIEVLRHAADPTPAGRQLIVIDDAPDFELFEAIPDGDPSLADAGCTTSPSHWPFNVSGVQKAIADGLAHLGDSGRLLARSVVRIADTGVAAVGWNR